MSLGTHHVLTGFQGGRALVIEGNPTLPSDVCLTGRSHEWDRSSGPSSSFTGLLSHPQRHFRLLAISISSPSQCTRSATGPFLLPDVSSVYVPHTYISSAVRSALPSDVLRSSMDVLGQDLV